MEPDVNNNSNSDPVNPYLPVALHPRHVELACNYINVTTTPKDCIIANSSPTHNMLNVESYFCTFNLLLIKMGIPLTLRWAMVTLRLYWVTVWLSSKSTINLLRNMPTTSCLSIRVYCPSKNTPHTRAAIFTRKITTLPSHTLLLSLILLMIQKFLAKSLTFNNQPLVRFWTSHPGSTTHSRPKPYMSNMLPSPIQILKTKTIVNSLSQSFFNSCIQKQHFQFTKPTDLLALTSTPQQQLLYHPIPLLWFPPDSPVPYLLDSTFA